MKNAQILLLSVFLPIVLALAVGDSAPDVTAVNQDGKSIHLSDIKGRFVLLYFYPKDETPGCTTEACSLRDKYGKIKELNTVVFGVSRQGQASHQEFKNKHKLPFDLLVDADGSLGKAFGVGTMFGIGLSKRQSFLIGPDGKIVKAYANVDPAKHADEIIADIETATAKIQGAVER